MVLTPAVVLAPVVAPVVPTISSPALQRTATPLVVPPADRAPEQMVAPVVAVVPTPAVALTPSPALDKVLVVLVMATVQVKAPVKA